MSTLIIGKRQNINVRNLISDDEVNIRDAKNYDIESMVATVLRDGRLTDAVRVMPHPTQTGKYLVLAGNRRTRAVTLIVSSPEDAGKMFPQPHPSDDAKTVPFVVTPDMVKALASVPCEVYPADLTPEQRAEIIYDHGKAKPLSKAETINGVWRLTATHTEGQIATLMHHQLATVMRTGAQLNAKLAKMQATDIAGRAATIKAHFHGTLGVWIPINWLPADLSTDFLNYVRESDGQEAPKPKYDWARPKLNALLKALRADRDADAWDYETRTGPETAKALNAMLPVTGSTDPETSKPLSLADMKARVPHLKSRAARAALQLASGMKGAQTVAQFDADAAKAEYVLDVLGRNAAYLPDALRPLADAILAPDVAAIEGAIKALVRPGAPILGATPAPTLPPVGSEEPDTLPGEDADAPH